MPRRRRRLPAARADAIALPPGTLEAPPDADPSHLEFMAWGPDQLVEPDTPTLKEIVRLRDSQPVTWINVVGLADIGLLEELGNQFDLPRLALDVTVSIPQRPLVEALAVRLDHCGHALDLGDSHRAHAGSIMDLHLSVSGQRMNEVMKVLTVIATLFIPLSFIAGLYGMNFDTSSRWNLPELGWAFGYPYALGLMLLCAGAMLVYFWRKGWFR